MPSLVMHTHCTDDARATVSCTQSGWIWITRTAKLQTTVKQCSCPCASWAARGRGFMQHAVHRSLRTKCMAYQTMSMGIPGCCLGTGMMPSRARWGRCLRRSPPRAAQSSWCTAIASLHAQGSSISMSGGLLQGCTAEIGLQAHPGYLPAGV